MTTEGDTRPATINRLIGVYDADGTIRGELAYWVGARLGRTHCALCDITHGLARERADWKACKLGLPVVFDSYHRNDQPAAVRSASANVVPVVVAETDAGIIQLLGPDELKSCGGSPEALVRSIESAVVQARLRWQ